MPIYFLLSIWVLLSVGREPTPQAYFVRGAFFYNALTGVVQIGNANPIWGARRGEQRTSPSSRISELGRFVSTALDLCRAYCRSELPGNQRRSRCVSVGSPRRVFLSSQIGTQTEIQVSVNTTEKITPPKFSIRVFGSVSVSGSQKTAANCLWWLVNWLK